MEASYYSFITGNEIPCTILAYRHRLNSFPYGGPCSYFKALEIQLLVQFKQGSKEWMSTTFIRKVDAPHTYSHIREEDLKDVRHKCKSRFCKETYIYQVRALWKCSICEKRAGFACFVDHPTACCPDIRLTRNPTNRRTQKAKIRRVKILASMVNRRASMTEAEVTELQQLLTTDQYSRFDIHRDPIR